VRNGIVDFAGEETIYLGEIPLLDAEEALRIAVKDGYDTALEELASKFPLREYLLNDIRYSESGHRTTDTIKTPELE
jgi:hypothetical protein